MKEKKFCIQGVLRGILLFFLLLSPITAKAAEEEVNYFDVLYNNYSGLPTSEANDIIQTSDGCIWIASYSSLVCYDGRNFVSYVETEGLSSVLCLYLDSQDRLWIGTNNDGVVLYENNRFTFVSEGQDVPSFSARCITENENGDILVGTALGMYTVNENFEFQVVADPRLEEAFIIELESFGHNNSFGITKTGDLFMLEGTTVVEFIEKEDWDFDLPLSVLPREDSFLVGTNSDYLVELTQNEQGDFSFEKIPTGSLRYINYLMEDSHGRIWLACDYGVGYMDQDGEFTDLNYLKSTNSVEKVIEDFEGNFWLASSREGVSKLNPSIYKNITASLGEMNQVNGVTLLDGLIYIASSGGIDILEQESLQPLENELTVRYEGGYIRCVQKDLEGNLWFSSYTEDGLIKYTPTTGEIKTFHEENGIDYSRIRSTMSASDGKIWVATGNGVYVIEDDVVIDYFGTEEGIQNLEILTISEDAEGRVFVGTDGSGVYIIEEGEIIQKLGRDEGLLSDIILRTETDPYNGGTWIVTGNSIAFYDIERNYLKNITKFPYGNNFDLLFYEDEMIILCSNGIFLVKHEDMLSDDPELPYLHKNHLNGLYSSAVANSFSALEDGVLYLCGYENVTIFSLDTAEKDSDYVPPLDLPKIWVNGEAVFPEDDHYYELPSTANFMQFHLLIPTYALENYDVAYTLEGFDTLAHHASYSDFIDPMYTNLPGGIYTFSVELYDNRTGELVNSDRFTISKEYAFLEHPFVQAVLAVMATVLLYGLVYGIMKDKEKKNKKQRDELWGMFHDTVGVLSKMIDAKDKYTNGHSQRVAFYTKELSRAMGFSDEEVESAYGVGLLHDVGKIRVPDEVLNKPGRLDQEEFEIMKSHARCGGDILEGIRAWPDLVIGAKYHHERYDGQGYNFGLKGEEIPQIARIICVVDAFDAMYSSRVYRKKMKLEDVLTELESNSGTQFDPKIVPIFVDLLRSGRIDQMLEKFEREDVPTEA